MFMRRNWILVLVATSLLLLTTRHVPANDALSKSLDTFACHIAEFLRSQGQHDVAIGSFTGPTASTGGHSITQQLAEKLKQQGITVKRRAAVGINGTFQLTQVDQAQYASLPGKTHAFLGLTIKASLVDEYGAELAAFSFDDSSSSGDCGNRPHQPITDEQTIVELIGISAELKDSQTPAERDHSLREALKNGVPFHLKGTKLFASASSPYAVEFLVGKHLDHLQPRAPELADGMPFLPMERGELLQLRIYNESDADAATSITLDGISIFEFSEIRGSDGRPKYEHYIVAPGKSTIPGWHKNNQLHHAFQIVPLAESAAGQLGHVPDERTITVVFKAAWPQGTRPPAGYSRSHQPDAFGFGPPVDQKVHEVKREIGNILASISVRYGSKY